MPHYSGNKGEWSEIYVLLKLLSEGRIYAADHNLKRISDDLFFPIIRIRREDIKGNIYDYFSCDKVKIYHNDVYIKAIERSKFEYFSIVLYETLISLNKDLFNNDKISSIQDFMEEIYISKIKSNSSQKADIIIEIFDAITGFKPLAGFSIKSQIGSPATLMNASQATNLIFKIEGINDLIMHKVNSINSKDKVIERFVELYKASNRIEFVDTKSIVFRDNLEMIDSKMPEILAHALVYRYRNNIKQYSDITNLLCKNNPMNYHNSEVYRYKLKKLLCASALGMLPATQWDGLDEANGGYIIVKGNGEILVFYLHNRNAFEEYLLRSTFLETPSTSRHDFASVYKQGNDYFINMNVQIRFKA